MATNRVQVEKKAKETKTEVEEVAEPKVPENAQAVKDELDELLEEIDSVITENEDMAEFWADIDEALGENLHQAADFVSNYLQKGGQ